MCEQIGSKMPKLCKIEAASVAVEVAQEVMDSNIQSATMLCQSRLRMVKLSSYSDS